MKPIPFDSLCLAAITGELRPWVGAKLQRVSQPNEDTTVFEWHRGGQAWFLISANLTYARAHFSTRKPSNPVPVPGFCAVLRSRLEGGFLEDAVQLNRDRVLRLTFRVGDHRFHLMAELVGKHANLILLDGGSQILAALKTYGPSRSTRPIMIGHPYPPIDPPADSESPFLKRWRQAGGAKEVAEEAWTGKVGKISYVPGIGAYPLPVENLGYETLKRDTLSIALEQAFDTRIIEEQTERLRRELIQQLQRVELAREVALSDLYEARDTAQRAGQLQRQAEIILAYAHEWKLERAWERRDYDGIPLVVRMDPELTALENAQRYFDKAKRAKAGRPIVEDQIRRIEEDLIAVRQSLAAAPTVKPRELDALIEAADRRKWRHAKVLPTTAPEDRPYAGNRIREYLGPGGFTILVGENSTANDYLTLRVAKPDDWWLHVRGATSAHVIIRTHRKPERVSKEVFEFAARLAVRHSTQKHASYVPVDITQRRYVRRIKGSAPGTVQYTHERTIHVEV